MTSMSQLQRIFRPIRRAIRGVATRGVVKVVHDTKKLQALQIRGFAGELLDDAERFQEYGFTSYPFAGAECAVVFAQAHRDHPLIIAVDDRRYRLQGLAEGEVALYSDEGDVIKMKRGNVIEITAATKVELLTPLVECSTDLVVKNDLLVENDVLVKGNLTVEGPATFEQLVTLDNADLVQTGGLTRKIETEGKLLADEEIECQKEVKGWSLINPINFSSVRNAYNAHTHDGNVPAPVLTM